MNIFKNSAPAANLQHSTFNVGNNNIMSTDFGEILPIYLNDVLPGDDWTMAHNVLCKVAPLVAPAFTRIKAYINSFYVSNQSIWKYWNNFITNKPSDLYPNAQLQQTYEGTWKVPSIPTPLIQAIIKIAKGMCKIDDIGGKFSLTYYYLNGSYTTSEGIYPTKYNVNYKTWTNGGMFQWELEESQHSAAMYGLDNPTISVPTQIDQDTITNYHNLGIYDEVSFLVDACIKCTKLFDNMGIPVELLAINPFSLYRDETINALPFMAYSKIWQTYFRDEQLQSSELCYRQANGPIYATTLQDTFWVLELDDTPPNGITGMDEPQLINQFPIDSAAKAFYVLTGYNLRNAIAADNIRRSLGINENSLTTLPDYYNGLCRLKFRNFNPDYFSSAVLDPMAGARNISVPNTITELRQANKLQEFLERSAWARDVFNFFKTHFGTKPESVTYNKPLMLGTQEIRINIGEQLQTSASTSTSPLGERAGVGEGYGSAHTCKHYFNEHGFIFSMISTIVDPQYYQGLPKCLETKESYLDYPFPEFANIGNQAIYSRELYYGRYIKGNISGAKISPQSSEGASNPSVLDIENTMYHNVENSTSEKDPETLKLDDVFGYVSRYSEQKFKLDEVHGEFRRSLNYWQTARFFISPQVLGHDFINYEYCGFKNKLNRIFAVEDPSTDHFYYDIFNNVHVKRSLPLISNPHA